MHQNNSEKVIPAYLDLLDTQRETAIDALAGLTDDQIWQCPEEKEWGLGEILNHNYKVMASAVPYARFVWRYFRWYGERRRSRPYKTDMPDRYRDGKFPMWTGFLRPPKYRPNNPVPLDQLTDDLWDLHQEILIFYAGRMKRCLAIS